MTPRFFANVAFAAVSWFALPLCAHAQTPPAAAPTAVYVRSVAKGVSLTQEVIPDGVPDGPNIITIIRINPKEAGVHFEAALGGDKVWGNDPTMGREIVSTLAARHNAVAGVNAGFFPFMGNPLGLHVQNGEIVTEPIKNRTTFFVDKKGVPYIGAWTVAGRVRNTQTGETLPLSGLNRKAGTTGDELLLYTPTFLDKTLRATGRTEAVLTTGPVPLQAGRDYQSVPASLTTDGQTPLLPGTMVLSGRGAGADFLKKAVDAKQTLSLQVDIAPLPAPGEPAPPAYSIADVREAVTGAPRLLTHGKETITLKEEGMDAAFSTTRHPRTAVGITAGGEVLLLTVDGRQKGLSRGASLSELAALLLKAGAADAVNLDGGGSSTCVVRGMVVNSPSEGKERPIADALLVEADNLPAVPVTRSQAMRMFLPTRPLKTGQTWNVARSSGAPSQTDLGVWGTRGGVGFVLQNGVYLAQRPGKGEVFFAPPDGSFPLSAPLTVVGASTGDAAGFAAKLTLSPDKSNPLRATLFIHAANAEGDPLGGETAAITVTGGRADAPTVTTDRSGDAQIGITWDTPSSGAGGERGAMVSSPAKRFGDAKIAPAPVPKPGS